MTGRGVLVGVGEASGVGVAEALGVDVGKRRDMRLVVPRKAKNATTTRRAIVSRPKINDFISYIIRL